MMTDKHKRHKKSRGPKPVPLSLWDHCLYWIGFLLVIGLGIFLSAYPEELIQRVAFSDPDLVAFSAGHMILRIPLIFYLALSAGIFLLCAYDQRRPIFGHKKGKYEPPMWKKEYPLFSKKRKKKAADDSKDKPFYRTGVGLWMTVAGILAVIYVFSLSFGWGIHRDGMLRKHILFGVETESCHVSSVKEMEISISRRYKKRTSDDYIIHITFETAQGSAARFYVGSFHGKDPETSLMEVIRLKSVISPEKIKYSRLDRLDNYLEDNRCTENETKLIYELFGLSNNREVTP